MPEPDTRSLLSGAVDDVLETMFFTVGLGEIDASMVPLEDTVGATLAFRGSPSGRLSVHVTSGAARSIAADFLATDAPEITARQASEVICEMANMICGSVVSALGGTSLFRLSSPVAVNGAAPLPPDAALYAIRLAGGSMAVTITTNRSECPASEQFAS